MKLKIKTESMIPKLKEILKNILKKINNRFGNTSFTARPVTLWQWEHVRDGVVIDTWEYCNTTTDEGLTHLLDLGFNSETQHSWYVALLNNMTPATTDTYSTVMSSGNYEFVAYKEATREVWTPGTPAAKSVDNASSKAEFTIDTGGPHSVYGAALVSLSTKNDATGGNYLYGLALFGAAKTGLIEDDILRVTVTLTLTNA